VEKRKSCKSYDVAGWSWVFRITKTQREGEVKCGDRGTVKVNKHRVK
jgi:hypothetical protein